MQNKQTAKDPLCFCSLLICTLLYFVNCILCWCKNACPREVCFTLISSQTECHCTYKLFWSNTLASSFRVNGDAGLHVARWEAIKICSSVIWNEEITKLLNASTECYPPWKIINVNKILLCNQRNVTECLEPACSNKSHCI